MTSKLSKEAQDARRPPKPEDLANALQDTVHKDVPHNSDLSTTWPRPTQNDDQRRLDYEEDEKKRAALAVFLEKQQERRAMWRKRRGWETP